MKKKSIVLCKSKAKPFSQWRCLGYSMHSLKEIENAVLSNGTKLLRRKLDGDSIEMCAMHLFSLVYIFISVSTSFSWCALYLEDI